MSRSRSQRKSRRFFFSEQQVQRLKYTNETLRKLNCSARSQLQHVRDSYLTKKQYREAGDSFEILALRINSVVQFRDGIITAARAEPEVIRVVFGTICDSCDDPLDEPQDDVPEVLKLDVGQLAEIDALVELAHRTEERVSARCMSRRTLPKAFFTGLCRLTRALLRQRRHLQVTAPEERTRIEVREEWGGKCGQCGKPLPDDDSNQLTTDRAMRASTRTDL